MVIASIEFLSNKSFYDPTIDKSISIGRDIYSEIIEIFDQQHIHIFPLQYQDKDTVNFSTGARLFKVQSKNDFFKVRLCADPEDASGISIRLNYAQSIGVPVCRPLKIVKEYLVLSYEDGKKYEEKISDGDITEISKIQSKMNSVRFEPAIDGYIENKVCELIEISLNQLSHKFKSPDILLLEKKLSQKPKKIIATFDHQDYGLHNLIKKKNNKPLIVDEEAFGVLPLGYGVIRPVFDRLNYRLAENISLTQYLKNYPRETQEYIFENISFFRSLFIARNCYRRIRAGNIAAAEKLLAEVKTL